MKLIARAYQNANAAKNLENRMQLHEKIAEMSDAGGDSRRELAQGFDPAKEALEQSIRDAEQKLSKKE